jgi:hypothetical protein
MAIGLSLILIAVGAILAFAVTATVSGLDVTVVGVILMIVGGFGIVLSMLFLATWAPFYRGERIHTREEVIREI